MFRAATVVLLTICLFACEGMRFVVEAVPPDDSITETVVHRDRGSRGWATEKVALIEVTGLMMDSRQPGLIREGDNPVGRLSESLRRASGDTKVKAIIVRINSPGGTVTSSAIMYDEVQRFKKRSKKPVVVLMSEVAASGGFYLACAGDEIIAQPTTITGSIGVIMQTFNVSEGMRRIGIRADAITSGPNKDVGSPFEPMSDEHRALLQGIVDEFYAGFREIVVTNRPGLDPSQVDEITDGRIVTGERAAEIGLIDRTGDVYDAFDVAKERAGIERAQLVKYHRPVDHVGSAYATAPTPPTTSQINVLQLNMNGGTLGSPAVFYYLWDPTVW